MSEHIYHLEIVTPSKTVFDGTVISTTLPGAVSPFQVLINHAAIVSALEVGMIVVVDADRHEHLFATSGGFAEMRDNRLTIAAESAEPAEDIDSARAERSFDRAVERINRVRLEHDDAVDRIRAEASLARATNRLKVISRLQG